MTASNSNVTALEAFQKPTTAETVVFYLAVGINLFTFLVLCYALCFRSYPPMKAQHVGISVILGLGGIIYCISNNIIQGMAEYNGFLGVCDFWGAWGMFTLGIGVLMSAINTRLILFYRIFITGKSSNANGSAVLKFIKKFWPFFVMWSPTLITSIVITCLKGRRGAWLVEDHGLRVCFFSNEYMYWAIVYLGIQFIVSWILYFRMRKVAKTFTGFRMAVWTLVIFTIILVVGIIIQFTNGFDHPWGRILSALVNTVLINIYTMHIFASPVFGHMFRREQTLRNFMNSLHKDALIAKQVREPGFLQSEMMGFSSLERFRQGMYDRMDDAEYIGQQPQYFTPSDITYSESGKRVL